MIGFFFLKASPKCFENLEQSRLVFHQKQLASNKNTGYSLHKKVLICEPSFQVYTHVFIVAPSF